MLYELVNMSDRYTFRADSLPCAAVVTVLLGNGQYMAKPLDDASAQEVPFFIFGGSDEWFTEHCGGLDTTVKRFVNGESRAELVAALRSVLIGDRAEYEETLPMIAESERTAWTAKWHERHRSSTNDIGKRARQLADRIERGPDAPAADPVPTQVFVG
jgi:hypothetical protein